MTNLQDPARGGADKSGSPIKEEPTIKKTPEPDAPKLDAQKIDPKLLKAYDQYMDPQYKHNNPLSETPAAPAVGSKARGAQSIEGR